MAVRLPLTEADRRVLSEVFPTLAETVGCADFTIVPLAQHASSRSYHRVLLSGKTVCATVVVMKLGEDPLGSDEATGGPRPSRLPFVEVAELLAQGGVPVPRILADRSSQGLVVLEDLGDETLEARLAAEPQEQWGRWYERAIDLLVQVHACEGAARGRDALPVRRSFGPDLLRWELEHFREWGLEAREIQLTPTENRVLDSAFDRIVSEISALPYGLAHRDFQSRNLMVHRETLRLIDFQDALLAPVAYDLVALLRDSYVELPWDLVERCLDRYTRARPYVGLSAIPGDQIRKAFHWITVQRKLKDAGRFVFIEREKGDPSFLRHIPSSLAYVASALDRAPELGELGEVLRTHLPELRSAL